VALTGNTVQSTYLDLVQLEKSGAGLPSHAGKEAAVYDGSGAQILGRTAVRHWLDPDPDAISGSFEFSTMGDKSQAQLEAMGFVFTECTAVVSNGLLLLTKTGAYNTFGKAELTVNLAGDFDYVIGFARGSMTTASQTGDTTGWGIYVADGATGGGAGLAHGVSCGTSALFYNLRGFKSSTYANLASGTLWTTTSGDASSGLLRVFRSSGTVNFMGGNKFSVLYSQGTTRANTGWRGTTQADASTFNKLILTGAEDGKDYPQTRAYAFIRRYA